MKFIDLVLLVLGNLSRRKARVGLTAIGVVIGTSAVVILVSFAIGLQMSATEQLYGIGALNQVNVIPVYDQAMFMNMPQGGSNNSKNPVLTDNVLKDLSAIPGVKSVIPREYLQASMIVKFKKMEGGSNVFGVGTDDLANLDLESMKGTTKLSRGTIVIGYLVAQNFQDPYLRPGQEPPPAPDLYDQQIQLTVIKYDNEGKEIRKNLTARVAGVLSESGSLEDSTIFMRLEQVKGLNEWSNGIKINYNKTGYNEVIVTVEDVDQVLDVRDQVIDMGFQANTMMESIQGINSFFMILQVVLGGVGAIALLVAGIGIANTMTMSILERTREIGLMKAVGATNRDVLAIFLGEAAGIGFIGGMGGVVIGWLASQGLNVVAVAYLAQQAGGQGGALPSVAVYTPWWLLVFVLLFSVLVGMLSGLYPALGAANKVPVLALKYE
jgi:putative ABC transport system permease protein